MPAFALSSCLKHSLAVQRHLRIASFTVLLFSIICKRKYCWFGCWLRKYLSVWDALGSSRMKFLRFHSSRKWPFVLLGMMSSYSGHNIDCSVKAHKSSSLNRNPALFNHRKLKRTLAHLATFHDVLFKYSYQIRVFEFQFLALATTQIGNSSRILPKAENLRLMRKTPSKVFSLVKNPFNLVRMEVLSSILKRTIHETLRIRTA